MSRNGSGTYSLPAGNPVVTGTTITSTWANSTLTDIATALTGSIAADGQTPITANLPMATFRHTGVGNAVARTDYAAAGQVQDGSLNWIAAGGTADAITAAYSPALTALIDGQICYVRAAAANATTTPTFSPNGLTAHTITKSGGTALAAGDIAGNLYEMILRYNLANTRWELLNPATGIGRAASGSNSDISSLNILASINGGAPSGLKNLVINGDCRVTSRPATIALTSSLLYGQVDRMMLQCAGGSAISGNIAQQTISGFSSGYAVGGTFSWTTGAFTAQHRIRASSTLHLNSRTITVSAKAYQTTGAARTFIIDVYRPTTTADVFSAQTLISSSAGTSVPDSTVTSLSYTLTLGTTDASKGLAIQIRDSATNTIVSKIYAVGDIDVRLGSVAPTYFETRPYEVDENLCYDYCIPLSLLTNSGAVVGVGASYGGNTIDTTIYFPRNMRAAPTFVAGNLSTWGTALAGSTQVSAYATTTGAWITITGALTVTATYAALSTITLRWQAATSFSVSGGANVISSVDPGTTAYLDAEL